MNATSSTSRYMSALANQYYARMQATRSAPARNAVSTPGSSGVDYSGFRNPANVATVTKAANDPNNPTGVRKVLDILSQPMYALVQTVLEDAARGKKGDTADIAKHSNPLAFTSDFVGNLGRGNQKKSWSDVLRGDPAIVNQYRDISGTAATQGHTTEDTGPLAANPNDSNLQKAGKFAGGLAADIVGDPLSYVGAGEIKNAAKLGFNLLEKVPVVGGAATAAKTTVQQSKLAQDLATLSAKAKGVKAAVKDSLTPGKKAAAEVPAEAVNRGNQIEGGPIGQRLLQQQERLAADPTHPPLQPSTATLTEADAKAIQDSLTNPVGGKSVWQAPEVTPEGTLVARGATETATPSMYDLAATPEKQKALLRNNVTGEIKPKGEVPNWKRLLTGAEKKFTPEDLSYAQKILREKPAAQVEPVVSSAAPEAVSSVVKAADTGAKIPSLTSKPEWLSAHADVQVNGIPLRQHALIATDKAEAARFIEQTSGGKATAQLVGQVQKHAQDIIQEQYAQAVKNYAEQITAARVAKAAASFPNINEWAARIRATSPATRLGQLIEGVSSNKGWIKVGQTQVNAINARKEIQAAYAAESARYGRMASEAPALASAAPEAQARVVAQGGAEGAAARRLASEAAQREAVAAAQADQAARAARPTLYRLSGVAKDAWVRGMYARGVDQEHIINLLAARTEKDVKAVIGKMARQKTGGIPTWSEFLVGVHKSDGVVEATAKTSVEEATKAADAPVMAVQREIPTVSEISAARPPVDPAETAKIRDGAYLNEQQAAAIREITGGQGLINRPADLPFTSKQNAMRSSQVVGEGIGHFKAYNAEAQELVMKKFFENYDVRSIREAAKAANPKGWALKANEQILQDFYKFAEPIEDYFFSRGVYPIASRGEKGIPLSLTQMMRAMDRTEAGHYFLAGRVMDLFGWSVRNAATKGKFMIADTRKATAIPGTMAMSSLLQIGSFLSKFAVKDVPLSKVVESTKNLDELVKNLAGTITKEEGFTEAALGVNKNVAGVTSRGITSGPSRVAVDAAAQAHVLNEARTVFSDPEVLKSLYTSIRENAAKANQVFASDVKSIADSTAKQILDTLDDATGKFSFTDQVNSLARPAGLVRAAADRIPTQMRSDLKAVAETETMARVAEAVPMIDIKNAGYAEVASKNGARTMQAVRNEENAAGAAMHAANAESALKETPDLVKTWDEVTDIAMNTNIGRTLDALGRRFVAHYGNATVHEAMVVGHSVGGLMGRAYRRDLTTVDQMARGIAKTRGLAEHKSVIKEAWDAVKNGQLNHVDPAMDALTKKMRNVMDYMFDTGATKGAEDAQSILSVYMRNGFSLDHINQKLAQSRFGLPESVRLKAMVPKGPVRKLGMRPATKEDLSNQWKSWKIDDPLDFLARMDRVITELSTETSISREFWRIAVDRGLGSTKPRPGFAAINRNSFGKDSLTRYLPTNENGISYVHKDLLPEIKRMDDLLTKAQGGDKDFNHFLRQNIDPIMAMWKAGMTVWRPGHHVRNMVGDVTMSYLVSGVSNPKYYAKALRMVTWKQAETKQTFRGGYGVWDAMKALQGLARDGGTQEIRAEALKGMAAPVVSAKIAGKNIPLDAKTIYHKLMDRGALPDFRTQEDIIDIGDNANNLARRIARGTGWEGSVAQQGFKAAHYKLAGFTEGRDDFVRIGHALHLIENGVDKKKTWGSVDEMFDAVAARIRKTHPDGSDLTPFEKRYMRLLFPFYSWTRKAIPLVVENTLTHPGRATAYPKFMYNIAQANGVDLQSLTDPFPEDSIFPSFLKDKLTGPLAKINGNYWSADFGASNADIMNDFYGNGSPSDILQGVGSMVNPALKTPFEVMSGTQVTGVPITNTNDYIDSQIPGFNSINSVAGVSPSSGIANLLHGKLGFDPNGQVAKGRRGGITENPEYALNYLFGARLLNDSKPNYITLARMQSVNKAGK